MAVAYVIDKGTSVPARVQTSETDEWRAELMGNCVSLAVPEGSDPRHQDPVR